MAGLGNSIASIGPHLTHMTSGFSSGGLDQFFKTASSYGPQIGAMFGTLTEFVDEFIGKLPILNRFAGPFVKALEDGKGTMLGFLLGAKETRDALISFGEAVLHLAEHFAAMVAWVSKITEPLIVVAATFLHVATAIVEFVANSKEILLVAAAILVVAVTLRTLVTVAEAAKAAFLWIDGLEMSIGKMGAAFKNFTGVTKEQTVVEDAQATAAKATVEAQAAQIASTDLLTKAIQEQTAAMMVQNGVSAEGLAAARARVVSNGEAGTMTAGGAWAMGSAAETEQMGFMARAKANGFFSTAKSSVGNFMKSGMGSTLGGMALIGGGALAT